MSKSFSINLIVPLTLTISFLIKDNRDLMYKITTKNKNKTTTKNNRAHKKNRTKTIIGCLIK